MTEAQTSKKGYGYCWIRFDREYNKAPGLEKFAVCIDTSEDATLRGSPDCANCPIAKDQVKRFYLGMFAPGCPTPYNIPPGFRDPGYEMVVPDGLVKTYLANIRRMGATKSSYKLEVINGFISLRDLRSKNGVT